MTRCKKIECLKGILIWKKLRCHDNTSLWLHFKKKYEKNINFLCKFLCFKLFWRPACTFDEAAKPWLWFYSMMLPWSRFPLHLMGEDSALWMLLLGILHHLWPSEAKGSTPNTVSNCSQPHPKNMFKNCNLCMESLSAVSLKDTVNHTCLALVVMMVYYIFGHFFRFSLSPLMQLV